MLSGLAGPTTHAGTPSCEPFNQHRTHVPKRQGSQASLPLSHQCPSAPLHSMQEWTRRRWAPFRTRQMPGRPGHYTHGSSKVHIEQTIPGLPREPQPGAQPEGARMDIVFNIRGHTHYIDTAVVTPFSSSAGLISAASARPGYMTEREEKKKFDRYTRINLVPLIIETIGRPGYRTKVHQTPLQRHGTPTNIHRGRLDSHSDHTAQQHLQTTAPSRHLVTPSTCSSPHHTRSSLEQWFRSSRWMTQAEERDTEKFVQNMLSDQKFRNGN